MTSKVTDQDLCNSAAILRLLKHQKIQINSAISNITDLQLQLDFKEQQLMKYLAEEKRLRNMLNEYSTSKILPFVASKALKVGN